MNTDESHAHNESYFIPFCIFSITIFCLVYVINKVELATKDETENIINDRIKYKYV